MRKVTGIGGIFFKCKDPKKLNEWYAQNLGLVINEYGSSFEISKSTDTEKSVYLQWCLFPADTKYFAPSDKEFMINYRVDNLVALVDELATNGVTIIDSIETFEYGKFVHIMDIEGNKIELWEPID
jgi:lactoylglutathione lyase